MVFYVNWKTVEYTVEKVVAMQRTYIFCLIVANAIVTVYFRQNLFFQLNHSDVDANKQEFNYLMQMLFITEIDLLHAIQALYF